ncbi:hypothetical protein M514_14794 [Trichuris suis]|nr:hypothetical protein M513_00031 [Trichuris suis]KFD72890.1 hypothetical protein M514_14794 [Trichuris suis]
MPSFNIRQDETKSGIVEGKEGQRIKGTAAKRTAA